MLPYCSTIESFKSYLKQLAGGINTLKNLSLFPCKEGKLGAVSVLPTSYQASPRCLRGGLM